MRRRGPRVFVWITAIALVAFFSLDPNSAPPGGVGWLATDKILHFATYLLLAGYPVIVLSVKPGRLLAIQMAGLLIGLGALGFGLEYAQSLVPGRVFSLEDFLANIAGVVSGLCLGFAMRRR